MKNWLSSLAIEHVSSPYGVPFCSISPDDKFSSSYDLFGCDHLVSRFSSGRLSGQLTRNNGAVTISLLEDAGDSRLCNTALRAFGVFWHARNEWHDDRSKDDARLEQKHTERRQKEMKESVMFTVGWT